MSKRVSSKIIRGYVDPDEFAYLNVNDQDLVPFRIKLPVPNDIERVANYGLEAKDQVFFKETTPYKLIHLANSIRDEQKKRTELGSVHKREQAFSELIWKRLYENYDTYKAELEWIRRMWHYRLYGKWFFINGKPTYITGKHWYYLNWWHLEGYGLPDYRDRDRRWFLAHDYLQKTTEAPKLNYKGNVIYNADGTLQMEDVGNRTVYGSNNVKARQRGETSKGMCDSFEEISRIPEGRGGLQAETGGGAKEIFQWKLVHPFKKIPFFFRPTVENTDPNEAIEFKSSNPEYGTDALMDYANTIYKHWYDKTNLDRINIDEAGKLDPRESVKERHDTLFKCIQVRQGFMIYTSTVYEITKSAGEEFLKLSNASHFHERNETKQTSSGLVNLFFSSVEHYWFVGKFGESVVDTPTPEQVPYLKNTIKNNKGNYMGAREFLLADRKEKERKGDIAGLIEAKRLEPMSFREAFTPPAKGEFFNRVIVENRMSELQMKESDHILRGDFIWIDPSQKNASRFKENKVNGRWNVSKRFLEHEANKVIRKYGTYVPNNDDKYLLSGDAFRAENTEGGKMSDGGGVVLQVRDKDIDPDHKNVEEWETGQFVASYRARPPKKEDYAEDMLKAAIYFGAWVYPESNVTVIEDNLKSWGYNGMLLYGYDKTTGKKKKVPGLAVVGGTKQDLFNRVRDWVENHGSKCELYDILKEISSIKGPDDMRNWDIFTSVAIALHGEEILIKRKEVKNKTTGFDLARVVRQRYV